MILFYIIISAILVSLASFAGVIVLIFKEKIVNKVLLVMVSFSAGSLMGGALLHLLPESISKFGSDENKTLLIFLYALIGFSVFFLIEQFVRWHHHHDLNCPDCPKTEPFSYMILISDGVHNFIDGLIIAVSYIVSIPVGIAATIAVALHEIPQEIGDFGVLIYGGFSKIKAIIFNFLSAITAVLGGIIGYFLSGSVEGFMTFLLPFAAGHFIYIASADLIPEIKHKESFVKSIIHFFSFLAGITLMLVLKIWL